MKKIITILIILIFAIFFIGCILRTERESICLADEVYALPTQLSEWIEPAEYIAKTIWGEARGCNKTQQAAVAWCILNRVDSGYGNVIEVITAKNQFAGYISTNPVKDELLDLSFDVISRWQAEKNGCNEVGRVLPLEYTFFTGNGDVNYFRDSYRGGNIWDWNLESPYE